MHKWPSVTPWNIYQLEAHWWRYLVTAAKQEIDAHKRAASEVKGGSSRGR